VHHAGIEPALLKVASAALTALPSVCKRLLTGIFHSAGPIAGGIAALY
jgi:hypothetical protein